MRKFLVITLAIATLFTGCATTGTSKIDKSLVEKKKGFPVFNHLFMDAKTNVNKYHGKLLAFEGKIVQKVEGHKGKPYLKLQVAQPPLRIHNLWVGSLLKGEKYLDVGSDVRVMGFFSKTEDDDIVSQKYNNENFHLLGFCFLSIKEMKMVLLEGTGSQCNEWMNGSLPQ